MAIACVSAYEYEHHYPKYEYKYGVDDHHTDDHKNAWEHGDGHHVKGGYDLKEADGTKRVVEYHSDGKGTHYHVKRIGHAEHPKHATSYQNSNLYTDH